MKGRLEKERTSSSCTRDSRTLSDELSSFGPYFSTSGGERECTPCVCVGGGGGGYEKAWKWVGDTSMKGICI